jgi:hypothetical protein
MDLKLVSIKPKDLVKNVIYLCGIASLIDEVDWYLCSFDGQKLLLHGTGEIYPKKFFYSPDGYTEDYLIFSLIK